MNFRIIFPLLLGLGGFAILCSLAIWQVQRLQWKQDVLAKIDAKITEAPIQIPLFPKQEIDNYLSVEVEGKIQEGELFVLGSRSGIGPGFRVVVPFEFNGRRILLDRGFIPESARKANRSIGSHKVIGNLQWPDEMDTLFTPEPEDELWFARDVESMARSLDTEPVLLVTKQIIPSSIEILPWPVDKSAIPNNHLNYAITWSLLAIGWLGMTIFWIWRIRRETDQ